LFSLKPCNPMLGKKCAPSGAAGLSQYEVVFKNCVIFQRPRTQKKMRQICSNRPTNLHFKPKKCHANHCNLFSSCTEMFSRAPPANGHTYSYSCEHFASVTRILVSQIVSYNPMSYTPFH
jgi:hypothetical protein